MPNYVLKFGRSNLKDSESSRKIVRAIKNYNEPVVIVVSAFYGVTDLLEEAIYHAQNGQDISISVVKHLIDIKDDAIEALYKNIELKTRVRSQIETELHLLKEELKQISANKDLTDRAIAHILSHGEKLSAIFLQGLLFDEELECELALPEQFGLYTDGDFINATIDFDQSAKGVKEYFSKNTNYVVPGFYGCNKEHEITLLGRGGSDYAAAGIARCIEALYLDIWKDVDGFMSADPSCVENEALPIKQLSYTEAAELAYFGAKILHPRTVEPLKQKNIPLRILNIEKNYDDIEPQSIISCKDSRCDSHIKSITYSNGFAILKLKGPGVGIKPGILAKVCNCLLENRINISSVLTSQISINILLDSKDIEKASEAIRTLSLPTLEQIVVLDDLSIIAAVGNGITEQYGIEASIFDALKREQINVIISCSGASQVLSYYVVNRPDAHRGIKAIHSTIFKAETHDIL